MILSVSNGIVFIAYITSEGNVIKSRFFSFSFNYILIKLSIVMIPE